MLKRLLSYIRPQVVATFESAISGTLEVVVERGKLILNTANTNYSYGNLQRVLYSGLQAIGIQKIRKMRNVLLLGVGAGSVIDSLYREIGFDGKVTAVDLDPVVLEVAQRYFNLKAFENVIVIADDANNYVNSCTHRYDLIIVDVFCDYTMPGFLFDAKFWANLHRLSNSGYILFNCILSQENAPKINNIITLLEAYNRDVQFLSKIEEKNDLLIAHPVKNISSF